MAFSFIVEVLNIIMVKRQKKHRIVQLNDPRLEEDIEDIENNSDQAR
jgi:hypothetical protein